MIASFGSGAAFALVSGLGNTPQGGGPITSAIVTGTMFALFQGAFYQVIPPISPPHCSWKQFKSFPFCGKDLTLALVMPFNTARQELLWRRKF